MTDACGPVEFAGPFVDALSMDMRFTLCNMGIELGAVAAYMQPDATTLDWVKKRLSIRGSDHAKFMQLQDFPSRA